MLVELTSLTSESLWCFWQRGARISQHCGDLLPTTVVLRGLLRCSSPLGSCALHHRHSGRISLPIGDTVPLQTHSVTERFTCLDGAPVKMVMCAELLVFKSLNGCAGLSSIRRAMSPCISRGVLNFGNDNDHSSFRLCVLKALTCPEHGPRSTPACLANWRASCSKHAWTFPAQASCHLK